MTTIIPENLEIYFKCDGDLEQAFRLVASVVPGVSFEAHTSEYDGIQRYYLRFPQGHFEGAAQLAPVLKSERGPLDIGIDSVDAFGFDSCLSFLRDTETDDEYQSVIALAAAIGKLCPAVLYTSETPLDGPFVIDTRV